MCAVMKKLYLTKTRCGVVSPFERLDLIPSFPSHMFHTPYPEDRSTHPFLKGKGTERVRTSLKGRDSFLDIMQSTGMS